MLLKEGKPSSRGDTSEKDRDILISHMQKNCILQVYILTVTCAQKIRKPQAHNLENESNSDIQSLTTRRNSAF
jgi:hypothetical protein